MLGDSGPGPALTPCSPQMCSDLSHLPQRCQDNQGWGWWSLSKHLKGRATGLTYNSVSNPTHLNTTTQKSDGAAVVEPLQEEGSGCFYVLIIPGVGSHQKTHFLPVRPLELLETVSRTTRDPVLMLVKMQLSESTQFTIYHSYPTLETNIRSTIFSTGKEGN